MSKLPRRSVIVGDALDELRRLPTSSVDVVITSPPYFQLRSYGAGELEHGTEPTVDAWVERLRAVCAELHRILVSTGSLWLNLGDSFSRHERFGAPPKSLLLGPERLALALVKDGWRLRNSVVWVKTNPMPSSVRDRLSCTWEHVYFFTKQSAYFFDLDAIRVPHRTQRPPRPNARAGTYPPTAWQGPLAHDNGGIASLKRRGLVGHPNGKNPGDVWHQATARYRGAHFATFPEALLELPIRSTCPALRCQRCRRPLARKLGRLAVGTTTGTDCRCKVPTEPGVILDPFMGAGTVAVAAEAHGRDWLGVELNPAFARQALGRVAAARSANHRERAA